MIVVHRLSFVFAVAIFSFHFSTRSIYVRMLPKWRTNSTPRTDNFPTHRATVPPCMVEAVALPWFVCNVFFIIAISFIWCCLDSWWRDHTLTLRWNGKREKSPRLLTLDVVVASWNQDKCFPSTTMCLYNSSTKLSLLCSNFSTFPHISVGCVCVCECVCRMCCACGMYTCFLLALPVKHTKFNKFNGALFYLACHCLSLYDTRIHASDGPSAAN